MRIAKIIGLALIALSAAYWQSVNRPCLAAADNGVAANKGADNQSPSNKSPANQSGPVRSPRYVPSLARLQPARTFKELSADAQQLAASLGIVDLMRSLESLESMENPSNKTLLDKMNLRQQILEALMCATTDVRWVTNLIDHEVAEADQRRAILAERRDRAVRLNTYANFISGGITGITGGSLKLGQLPSMPADVIDTVEGTLQTGLSLWAFRQERGEHQLATGVPSLLLKIIAPDKFPKPELPPSVWTYLNAADADYGDGMSRRDHMILRWRNSDFWETRTGRRNATATITNNDVKLPSRPNVRVSIHLLEDRIAMLYDLRSIVSELEDNIGELGRYLRQLRMAPNASPGS